MNEFRYSLDCQVVSLLSQNDGDAVHEVRLSWSIRSDYCGGGFERPIHLLSFVWLEDVNFDEPQISRHDVQSVSCNATTPDTWCPTDSCRWWTAVTKSLYENQRKDGFSSSIKIRKGCKKYCSNTTECKSPVSVMYSFSKVFFKTLSNSTRVCSRQRTVLRVVL